MQPKGERQEDLSDANFDEWSGYSGALFNQNTNDLEDKEADQAYQKVDEYLDQRKGRKREEKMREKMVEMEKGKKDI